MASRRIHSRGNSSSNHAHASAQTLTATARGTMGVSASICTRRFRPRPGCTQPGIAADVPKSNSNPITPVILTDRVGQMPSQQNFPWRNGSLGEAEENSPRREPWVYGLKETSPGRGERIFHIGPVCRPYRGLDGFCGLEPTVKTVGYYRTLLRSVHFVPSTMAISSAVRP